MDLLGRLMTGTLTAGTPGPFEDYWYQSVGVMTQSGVRIGEEEAKKVSAWFRGRELLAASLAMLPLGMFERLPNDQGRQEAPRHPVHDVIHRKPNGWQDSFGWRRQRMYDLIDHGNSYDRIVRNGFISELWPIDDPTRVTPERLANGSKVFRVRDKRTGRVDTFTQDEIFHLCSMSEDGVVGRGILQYARESLGLSATVDLFAQKLFSRGSLNAGVIETPAVLDEGASKRMAESFVTAVGNWHLPKVLEQGAKFNPGPSMTAENAQMLLSRKFSVTEIARWLGVPPHMIADLDRSTNNNIEQQGQEFVTFSLGPWLSLFEFAINDQLVSQPQKYYAEFNRDAMARGDLATRWSAYVDAVTTGTYTRNEIRILENRKALPGLDEPLNPAFLTGKSSTRATGSSGKQQPAPPEGTSAQARAIAAEAAGRLLRKEITAIQKLAVKHAADAEAFGAQVDAFYDKHRVLVQQTLHISEAFAHEYCENQLAQVTAVGLQALEQWAEAAYAEGLAAWALDEEECG